MNNVVETPIRAHYNPRNMAAYKAGAKAFVDGLKEPTKDDFLSLLDMGFPVMKGVAIHDADAPGLITTANAGMPNQYLQTFLPGVVRMLYTPMKLNDIIGYTQAGFWEDAEIVQRFVEWTGRAQEYGDYQPKPKTSWNPNFLRRSVVRFEVGYESTKLQGARSARAGFNDLGEKQQAAELVLAQILHKIGWYGYNGGNNQTYGFLNDPNNPAYVPVASSGTGSSPLWVNKTWIQRQNDLLAIFNGLQTQTDGAVEPMKDPTCLVIPNSLAQYFGSTTDLGYSLKEWLDKTYPLCRLESAVQLDGAAAGLNAMVLYAESVPTYGADADNGSVFLQVIPAMMTALGIVQTEGGFHTAITGATAGTMNKRPFASYFASSM